MSLFFLARLAQASLPVTVFSGEDVDRLRVLCLAGHVKATIPLPVRTLSGYDQPPATVEEVTPQGMRMLRRFPQLTAGVQVSPKAKPSRKRLLGRF